MNFENTVDDSLIKWDEEINAYKKFYFETSLRKRTICKTDLIALSLNMGLINALTLAYFYEGFSITSYFLVDGFVLLTLVVVNLFFNVIPFFTICLSLYNTITNLFTKRNLFKRDLNTLEIHRFWNWFINIKFKEIEKDLIHQESSLKQQSKSLQKLAKEFNKDFFKNEYTTVTINEKLEDLQARIDESNTTRDSLQNLKVVLLNKVVELVKILDENKSREEFAAKLPYLQSKTESLLIKTENIIDRTDLDNKIIKGNIEEIRRSIENQFESAKDMLDSNQEVEKLLN